MERGKPDPCPYLKALEKLNLTYHECIVVENAPLGITAAKEAKLYCVAVASRHGSLKSCEVQILCSKTTTIFFPILGVSF